jgi:EmrB/QacA subfamily drug resistance transporter
MLTFFSMHITKNIGRFIVTGFNYKRLAYMTVAMGMVVMVMVETGVNIALPAISDHFSVDIPTVQWLTLGFILSISAMLMPMGRLSDMIGRKSVYVGGFVVYIFATLIAGIAQTFSILLVCEIIRGIGAAGIQANGIALMVDIFSERERGKALGFYMATIGVGAMGGPIIGGVLVNTLGWRSIFFASVPASLLAMLIAIVILRVETKKEDHFKNVKFDWGGAWISSSALISFLLGMTNGYRLGWNSPLVVIAITGGCILLALFLWWENRIDDPMLDLKFFRMRVFSLGISARASSFLSISSVFFLMPFYLVQGLGYTASKAGFMILPSSVLLALSGPIGGWLSDKIGTRIPSVAGMIISSIGMFLFSDLSVNTSPGYLIIGMAMLGLGPGMFSAANSSAIMSSVSNDSYGIASGFLNLTRTFATILGVVMATTVVTLTMTSYGYPPTLIDLSGLDSENATAVFVSGMNKTFLIMGYVTLVGVVLAWLRGEAVNPRT